MFYRKRRNRKLGIQAKQSKDVNNFIVDKKPDINVYTETYSAESDAYTKSTLFVDDVAVHSKLSECRIKTEDTDRCSIRLQYLYIIHTYICIVCNFILFNIIAYAKDIL